MVSKLQLQSFVYEKKEGSAAIWRCFSNEERAEIPEELEGLRVSEVAPYAFSEHMDERVLQQGLEEGRLFLSRAGMDSFGGQQEPLKGRKLREILLPDTVEKVGKYCFYNCEHLEKLEFAGGRLDWGSGVFTGCHQIKKLQIRQREEGLSLREILEEVREELRVDFMEGNQISFRLVFPEFYEEGVENTPARILENHVHGSGILYRNCVGAKGVDFRRYDRLFPHAKAQEPGRVLFDLAFGRLKYPKELSGEGERQYRDFLAEEWEAACAYAVSSKDMEAVKILARIFSDGDRRGMEKLADLAASGNFPEASGWCMDCLAEKKQGKKRRRRLEL